MKTQSQRAKAQARDTGTTWFSSGRGSNRPTSGGSEAYDQSRVARARERIADGRRTRRETPGAVVDKIHTDRPSEFRDHGSLVMGLLGSVTPKGKERRQEIREYHETAVVGSRFTRRNEDSRKVILYNLEALTASAVKGPNGKKVVAIPRNARTSMEIHKLERRAALAAIAVLVVGLAVHHIESGGSSATTGSGRTVELPAITTPVTLPGETPATTVAPVAPVAVIAAGAEIPLHGQDVDLSYTDIQSVQTFNIVCSGLRAMTFKTGEGTDQVIADAAVLAGHSYATSVAAYADYPTTLSYETAVTSQMTHSVGVYADGSPYHFSPAADKPGDVLYVPNDCDLSTTA